MIGWVSVGTKDVTVHDLIRKRGGPKLAQLEDDTYIIVDDLGCDCCAAGTMSKVVLRWRFLESYAFLPWRDEKEE